jgi:WD40 repeat protein
LLQRWQGHHTFVSSVAWSPDGRQLASAGGGRDSEELCVWDVHSGEQVCKFTEHSGVIYAVIWSPDGDQLISGGSDGKLCWRDVHNGKSVRVQTAHQGAIRSLKLSPNRTQFASSGDDGAIRIWNLHTGDLLRTLRRDRPYERLIITNIQGLTASQKSSLRSLGAIDE